MGHPEEELQIEELKQKLEEKEIDIRKPGWRKFTTARKTIGKVLPQLKKLLKSFWRTSQKNWFSRLFGKTTGPPLNVFLGRNSMSASLTRFMKPTSLFFLWYSWKRVWTQNHQIRSHCSRRGLPFQGSRSSDLEELRRSGQSLHENL